MKDKDTYILEEEYNIVQLNEVSWESINKVGTKLGKTLLGDSLSTYLASVFKYLKNISVVGVGISLAAQILGSIFIGISKMLDKDVEAKKQVRDEILNIKYGDRLRQLAREKDLTTEEIYEAYLKIKKDLGRELDEKYPLKGKYKWAIILDKIGNIIKDKIGTTALALSGIYLYTKLNNLPSFNFRLPDELEQDIGYGRRSQVARDAYGKLIPMSSAIYQNRPPMRASETY